MAPVVADGHEGEGRLGHLQGGLACPLAPPNLDRDAQGGASDRQEPRVAADLVADEDRVVDRDRVDRESGGS
ncbi:hypothetical protein ACRBEV_24665 [Methylobacterium phyllosphaerae]